MGVEGTGEESRDRSKGGSLHTVEAWDDGVSATDWVCVQLWYAFRCNLGLLSTSGDKPPIATKNGDGLFGCLHWRFYERAGFGEREKKMGAFPGASWKSQPNNSFCLILSDFMMILRLVHGVGYIDCPFPFTANIILLYDNKTVC